MSVPSAATNFELESSYRVPSMAEIEAVPYCGFDSVSTFSGGGGTCLGFRMAGFRVLWANEFIKAAQETYRANHPQTILDGRSIRDVQASEILEAIGKGPGELHVFEGSPPCNSFSTSGQREKNWGKVGTYGDTAQRCDDLFFEYARLLRELQPWTFVAENVKGLVIGKAKGYFKAILRELRACGYQVKSALLDAKWLGVPQSRPRVIFLGVRDDLARYAEPRFPKPRAQWVTLREACPWIDGQSPAPESTEHDLAASVMIDRYVNTAKARKLVAGEQARDRYNLLRAHFNRPSYCVNAMGLRPSGASVMHPTELRKFTILELKRLCSFPDDFVLTGTRVDGHRRLGMSVPPLMARAIAETMRDAMLRPIAEAIG